MILDTLDNLQLYKKIIPNISLIEKFLGRKDLSILEDGKYELAGDKLFAIVASNQGQGKKEAKLEVHRKYMDIQYCIRGIDYIGWQTLAKCKQPLAKYNEKTDCQFFSDKICFWNKLSPKTFAIFFPHDAHAPLAGKGFVKKVVVKVAI